MSTLEQELLKAGLNSAVAILTLCLGWFIGQRLTLYWAIRQRRRELELSAANEFYKLYGEFFAVWKLWNYCKNMEIEPRIFKETRWELLKRSSAAEAGIEAVFVKLASERVLNDKHIEILGKFRQAYQRLRESIRNDKKLDWSYSEHPEYVAFKDLAARVSCLITSGKKDSEKPLFSFEQAKLPTPKAASSALRKITSNIWENQWIE